MKKLNRLYDELIQTVCPVHGFPDMKKINRIYNELIQTVCPASVHGIPDMKNLTEYMMSSFKLCVMYLFMVFQICKIKPYI